MIYVVFGLPFIGKREFSRMLARQKKCMVISTSELRDHWISEPTYRLSEKRAVYLSLLQQVAEEVTAGRSVVACGCFHREEFRMDMNQLAEALGTPVVWIYYYITHDGTDPGRVKIHGEIREMVSNNFQSFDTMPVVQVDDSLALDSALSRIDRFSVHTAGVKKLEHHE